MEERGGHSSRVTEYFDTLEDEFMNEWADEEEEETNALEEDGVVDLEETEALPLTSVTQGGVEIIMDLREWLKTPWDTA